MPLNEWYVHQIRTAGLTDTYWAQRAKVPRNEVQYARVGKTWQDHPTPPDQRARYGGGRKAGKEAMLEECRPDEIQSLLAGWKSPRP